MAGPQAIVQKVKFMCFSDSTSLRAALLGMCRAEACLDAFEECIVCILLESQRARNLELGVLFGAESAGRDPLDYWRGECLLLPLLWSVELDGATTRSVLRHCSDTAFYSSCRSEM